VPELKRGSVPAIDVARLEAELRQLLADILQGDFMRERVPEGARRLMDIAVSGNGEPTTAREFPEVVALAARVMAELGLRGRIKLVLITNGSMMHRPGVQHALDTLRESDGEVWFKIDRATPAGIGAVNGVRSSVKRAVANLAVSAARCPTWIQTCMFALDGAPPPEGDVQAYLDMLGGLRREHIKVEGVLLYGLARPSLQAEASRLSALPKQWLEGLADEIESRGYRVRLTP
jgi:wyosine [tRNA(Phe)-imidazoG37] synthetase (radical SAM superfamily)